MRGLTRTVSLGAAAILLASAAWAQYYSEVVGFNENEGPLDSHEMFKVPEWSSSTSNYIIPNDPNNPYFYNNAHRKAGHATEGAGAMKIYFNWVDETDSRAWVRATTFSGPERPNPALHLQGKVRFRIVNVSEFFDGDIGVCLGIRETGVDVAQLADGGTSGDIEWVGVTGVLGDPNDPNDVLTPVPALILPPSVSDVLVEWNLSTGIVTLNGASQGGGFAGFTGDGVLSAANNRGTLEHIAFVNQSGDVASYIEVHIDELRFESPVPDPVTPPTVVAPIIADDVSVIVTDLIASVNRVSLYRDGGLVEDRDVADPNDVVFDISAAPAVSGEVFTATQRDSITGDTSGYSDGVTVLPEASPFSFSIVIDEDGNNCGFDAPGGWEFVPVTAVGAGPMPTGVTMFNDNAVWQTIDVPLDDPNEVIAWLGGNGTIDPSPNGYHSIDSIWFTLAPGGDVGPHEIFIDRIELLDASDVLIQVISDMENGVNYLQYPRGQSTTTPTTTALSTLAAFDGLTSHRITWTYPSAADEALGMYHDIGYACNTSPTFPDTGAKIRFHLLARGQADPNTPVIPVVYGPIVGNQSSVRILNDAAATALQLYINGDPEGDPEAPTGTETDFTGLTLAVGDSISVTQIIGAVESDFAYPLGVAAAPVAPTVQAPIAPGATLITLTGVYAYEFATATEVEVFVNGSSRGTATPTGDTVVVTISPAVLTNDLVTATQTVNGATSDLSDEVTVAYTAPVIYVAPAQGDTIVTVMEMDTSVTSVTVVLNGTTEFTETPTPGLDRWDVTVSGLTTGDTINAYYEVGAIQSVVSESDIVTTATQTVVVGDDFEYDETTYLAQWETSGTGPRPVLSTDRNATYPTGAQSVFIDAGSTAGRLYKSIPETIPTATDPVIWNVHIYDAYGPGASNVQFAQLNGVADWWYQHIGMLSWAGQDLDYYQYRGNGNGGPDWIDLTEYDAPMRSVGWHTFTVVHKGDFVDVYVDGLLSAKNIPLTSQTELDSCRIGPGYASTNSAYYDDFCVEVGPVRFEPVGTQPPAPASIAAPIEDGDELVTVTGVDPDVTLVQIIDEGLAVIGSAGAPDPNGVVDVTLTRALVHLETITAEATNAVGTTASDPLEVGAGNGDILVCIGVRETGDTGPLGSEGGTTGDIEWVGASSAVNGAPQGVAVAVSDSWQTLTFDPLTDPITGFVGDDSITETRGTLEHLAIAVDAASADCSTGRYDVYIDNVINVGADSGADFLIEDFEGYTDGDEVLFQEPTNSGSTADHMTLLPSASEVSSDEGNPGSSEWLVWFFKDTTDQRWARITTSAVTFTSRPIIDLTKPIRFDLLLASAEPVVGDTDGDGDVDLSDLAALLASFDKCVGDPDYFPGADFDDSGCVDLSDLATLLSNFGYGT